MVVGTAALMKWMVTMGAIGNAYERSDRPTLSVYGPSLGHK